MTIPKQFRIRLEPVADPAAVVLFGAMRFTVLTSRLIRIEHSPDGQFEDQASQTFWFRKQPVPRFTSQRSADGLEITTEHLHLTYHPHRRGLAKGAVTIQVKATGTTWRYGDNDAGNLLGTMRTLDDVYGRTRLERGLMSRSGWAVVDDSQSLVFSAECWLERRKHPGNRDLYFFGYGHAYQDCLRDYCAVAGNVPMIPRWILGNWWSRYWAYTQDELTQLMVDFQENRIPLSVCIVDMDWHITNTGNESSGWTGYTWNRALFPDPQGFIAWLHEQGLHTALNLHPALGVYPHEEQYREMAQALGIDPESEQPVPFDIADPAFVKAYLEILHYPLEKQGVDFWWMDWQQGTQSKLAGMDPLYWLNHLHFLDRGRDGTKRPFIFSRWSGLSNHRYPIGFSGDSHVSWEALAFQPYLTATAANVSFGWWSHDIGGHHKGIEDPELYARWVQFGVFSPILRLHCTNNAYHDRRPWGHGAEVLAITRDVMQLRHALIPYIYSMAWRNHTTSLPLMMPMYYMHPETEDAYHCPDQYFYGTELVAAPFITKRDADTRLARQTVWLPEGDWFHFFSGEHYAGGQWHAVYGALEDVPVFAKAGAIVPLGPKVGWGGIENPSHLDVHVFPGAGNRFELYEDDGDSTAYTKGAYSITELSQEWHGDSLALTIAPARGDASHVPPRRTLRLLFRGVAKDARAVATVNGAKTRLRTSYDEATETLECSGLAVTPADNLCVTVSTASGSLLSKRDRRIETCRRMLRAFRLQTIAKQSIDARLPALMGDSSGLGDYWLDLKESQSMALVEILRRKALDRGA